MATYGLIGYPLSHSFSKKYFNDRFLAEGLQHTFENFPLENISAFPELIKKGIAGFAVTIPYKESVIPYLDSLDEDAAAIGAVNCITIKHGKTKGHNTDAAGFEKSILPVPVNISALVLGTGGASKAVGFVLAKHGIPFQLVGRKRMNQVIAYDDLSEKDIRQNLLLVNTTPLGMYPDLAGKPGIPYQAVTSQHFLYDLVYNPELTSFMNEGKVRGARVKNGLEMLYNQAEENWHLWFDL